MEANNFPTPPGGGKVSPHMSQPPSAPLDYAPPDVPPALEPHRIADMPERTLPFWKLTGPSAVLVGLAIGGGELVIWPRMTAQHGASMVWAAALGVIFQLLINIEVGRWAISTGESMYTGFTRVWRGFAITF